MILFFSKIIFADTKINLREQKQKEIERRLEYEQSKLSRVESKEADILKKLRVVEEELSKRKRETNKIKREIDALNEKITKSEEKIEGLSESINSKVKNVSDRLNFMYRMKGFGMLTFVMNSMNFSDFIKKRKFLEIIIKEDSKLITSFKRDADDLLQERENNQNYKKSLLSKIASLKDGISTLENMKSERNKIFVKIREEKEFRLTLVNELRQAEIALNKTISKYFRESSAIKIERSSGFESFKGKLLLPAEGKIIRNVEKNNGDPVSQSEKNGMSIAAPSGNHVRSIFSGKVMYADWFSGFGRVIILDHGDGFISLYAHLAEMRVKTGQTVRENQVIGEVGDTGSLKGAYLYIEIRKDGEPLEPDIWFER